MSESPRHVVPDLSAKGPMRVAGAGTFGMGVLIVSLSMLFLASMLALMVIRARSSAWPPHGMPRVPSSLWISTVVILLTLAAVQRRAERDPARRAGAAGALI